jgi:transposase-like protein
MVTEYPGWLPDAVRRYLEHTADGISLRALARREGCHASTVLRQVRRYENRRDDPLMDEALARLGRLHVARSCPPDEKDDPEMSAAPRPQMRPETLLSDDVALAREGRRILRRLAEPDTVLAVAGDMEKAVVLREFADGRTARTAVVDRAVAQAFVLKDWIDCRKPGRVSTYVISPAGRAALKRLVGAGGKPRGMAEAAAAFGDQHRDWDERDVPEEGGARRRVRFNAAESPVAALSRRRDKEGKPFLAPELVTAAERLREDFELAQMGPRVAQNWDRFLTAGDRGGFAAESGPAQGPRAARERVAAALRDLGPGLGDMALRCCCFLEGLEMAERRMGWSARSGKIVLRIALMRLKRHYEENGGLSGPLIG